MRWEILQAMSQCQYKAWMLSKIEHPELLSLNNNAIAFPFPNISAQDKTILVVWYSNHANKKENENIVQVEYGTEQKLTLRLSSYTAKAQKIFESTKALIGQNEPPVFHKNKNCRECPFWTSCYPKLKEKDCISLLGGISPKTISKYNSRGILSITQLSYLFRPRRRGRKLPEGKYLWELKALALRDKKTFVLQSPELQQNNITIYFDIEGLPDENFYYLFSVLVKEDNKEDRMFSFWIDDKKIEQIQLVQLIELFNQYNEAPVYHYGSYEAVAFKQLAKKYINIKEQLLSVEKRMVNLLTYLRTNVYPPTYGNGLKEIAGFLGFVWDDVMASGLQSIDWRKRWEITHDNEWKEKLIQYNRDDCKALAVVHQWLFQLTVGSGNDDVQQVSKMRKHTPFKLQSNKEFGEDFQYISKAAYFDYQRNKIYWRNSKSKVSASITQSRKPPSAGKGKIAWQPKKVNEIVVMPALKACPHCGHKKLYHSRTYATAVKQTDIKFTAFGIRQYVTEYRTGSVKCASCKMRTNNANLRIRHYGDNLFAFATYLYINFNISNELVSRLIQEQFGVWMSQMYLVMNKHKWWKLWQPEFDYIRQTVLNSSVLHIDETTFKLDTNRSYIWVFATTHSVFYKHTLTHEANFLQEILKDYKGIIITDFFSAYETLEVRKQKCLIHLIRDLNDDLFKNPFDEEYKQIVSNFSKLLRIIIATVDKYGLKKRNLKKHIKDTEIFYKTFVEATYKSELASKCVKRLKKHWECLWTFLYYDNVPWNNNNAEAAVKAFAMYRRGVNGQVSEVGINQYLPMLSMAQTCRYRNISFLDFLRRKKGLWHNIHSDILPDFLPFAQARLFARQMKFKNKSAWNKWTSAHNCPTFMPIEPAKYYKDKGWKDWEDWLEG